MFSRDVHEFMNKRGMPVVMGTRDADLQPAIGRAFALKIENENSLAVFIPQLLAEKSLENLLHNKRIAITQGDPYTSTSFQFKGEYLDHETCSEEDMAFVGENFGAFVSFLANHYGPELAEQIQKKDVGQFVKIKVKVEEIFNQTPGPGAGKKIN